MGKRPGGQDPRSNTLPAAPSGPDINNPPENRDVIRRQIEQRIGPLLPAGAPAQQVVESVTALMMEESYSGPIPHPRHIGEYERILPGSADRLISMVEKQLDHNMAVNKQAMDYTFADARLGMILGFLALVLLIVGAGVSILMGSEVGAGLFLGAGALGVIGLFLKRKLGNTE